MTDLTGKFNGLENALATRLDTVITLLQQVNSNLIELQNAQPNMGAVLGRLDTLQSMAGTRNNVIIDILHAIGGIQTYPANYTVRRLLAMLQTALDSEPGELGPTLGAPSCAGADAEWVQCTGWGDLGERSYNGNTYHVFSPQFGSNLQNYGLIGLLNVGNQRSIYKNINVSDSPIAIGWNFPQGQAPAILIKRVETLAGDSTDWADRPLSDYSYVTGNLVASGCNETITSGFAAGEINPGDIIVEYFFLFGTGITGTPPLTVWLASEYVSGS